MAAPTLGKRKKLPSGVAAALAATPAAKQLSPNDLKAFIDAARNAKLMQQMSHDFI